MLVYDPHIALDLQHITRISTETPAILVPVPYSRHPISTFLSKVSLLQPLLEAVLHDRFDPKAIKDAIRARRSTSSVYLGTLAERQPTGCPRVALSLARAAHAARAENPRGMLSLARILTRTGNHVEAVTLHREISVRTERLPLYLTPFADDLWLADAMSEAIVISEEVVNALPKAAHLRTWYAAMLWKHGVRSAAINHQKLAVSLAPKNRRYRRRLYFYRMAQ